MRRVPEDFTLTAAQQKLVDDEPGIARDAALWAAKGRRDIQERFDDAVQIAEIAVRRAAFTWTSDDPPFYMWALKKAKWAILDAMRVEAREQGKLGEQADAMDAAASGILQSNAPAVDTVGATPRALLQSLRASMSGACSDMAGVVARLDHDVETRLAAHDERMFQEWVLARVVEELRPEQRALFTLQLGERTLKEHAKERGVDYDKLREQVHRVNALVKARALGLAEQTRHEWRGGRKR